MVTGPTHMSDERVLPRKPFALTWRSVTIRRIVLFALISEVLLLACCGSPLDYWRLPEEDRAFFKLASGERRTAFVTFPVHRQIRLYLHAAMKSEPADFAFAELIAARGYGAIPELLVVVRRADGCEKLFVIYIIALMAPQEIDRAGRGAVTSAILAEAKRIDDQSCQDQALSLLDDIVRRQVPTARPH